MPKPNRRSELLAVALEKFQTQGFEGTSVADIVEEVGMSKAAFGYHLSSKDDLLVELVGPLLDELEAVLDRFPAQPSWPDEGGTLLAAYFDVLLAHRAVVIWIEGDTAALLHPIVGKRLSELNRRMRHAIRGDDRSAGARLAASAALGTLWRPLRNLPDVSATEGRAAMLDAALAVVRTIRS